MSSTTGHFTRARVASIALLALMPIVATAQNPLSSSTVQQSESASAPAQARVTVSEMSGLLVWAWRGDSQGRQVSDPSHLSRFAATPPNDLAPMGNLTMLEFRDELVADRGRLDHGGNLFRIDF